MFGLGGDQGPGPDGSPLAFFHCFWDMLEDDMVVFFNEIEENGVLVGELGACFIALILKKDCSILIKDFCLISLIGSLEDFTKVLGNRWRKVLPKVIFYKQVAFVDGCQILGSMVIVHECVDFRTRQ